jgi:hypothetical protein
VHEKLSKPDIQITVPVQLSTIHCAYRPLKGFL